MEGFPRLDISLETYTLADRTGGLRQKFTYVNDILFT